MNTRTLVILLTLVFIAAGCGDKNKIADRRDYDVFMRPGLVPKQIDDTSEELKFWKRRLQKDTGNLVDMLEMARCHLQIFRSGGNVDHLLKGDSLLKRSSAKLNDTDPEILFALSQSSTTQHEFRLAGSYNEKAGQTGGDKYVYRLLEFDTKFELGDLFMAAKAIEKLKDKSAFDYLIRKSKIEDQKGNLEKAIGLMEQAFEKAKEKNNSLYCWALSNLADMYGHAGRVKDAYNAYIEVLEKDSGYLHALRGIAWIAYSHDHDDKEAKRILEFILDQTKHPELRLILAEIEKWNGNESASLKYIHQFEREVKNEKYGAMYNKYLVQLYADDLRLPGEACKLAEKEALNRPTPEIYDCLAWACYKKGDMQRAYSIALNYVYKRHFEPGALLHTAIIFSSAGKKEEAKKLLEECLESSFELGPVKTKFIEEQLKSLKSSTK